MMKNKYKIILLLNEIFYIIIIPSFLQISVRYGNGIDVKPHFSIKDLIIPILGLAVIFLVYLFSKLSLKKKVFKVLDRINLVLSVIFVLIFLILEGYCYIINVDFIFTGIMLVLLGITLFLTVLNIMKMAKIEKIKLEKIDYLPIILNLIFTLILIIVFFVNNANLSNIYAHHIIFLYYYMLFLIVPHLLFNIYLSICMSKKNL